MWKISDAFMIGFICATLLGCEPKEQSNKMEESPVKEGGLKEEYTLNEENLYDIYFIRKAPKAMEKHDLSKVIKVVSTKNINLTGETIAIDVQNRIIHIDPWVSTMGVNSIDEAEDIDDLDQVIDILEKFNVQD